MTTPPPLTFLDGPRTAGIPDPAVRVPVNIAGRDFDAGNRTAAHLRKTIRKLAKRHPDARLEIIKPCYVKIPPGVDDPSAGTHDGDGVGSPQPWPTTSAPHDEPYGLNTPL